MEADLGAAVAMEVVEAEEVVAAAVETKAIVQVTLKA